VHSFRDQLAASFLNSTLLLPLATGINQSINQRAAATAGPSNIRRACQEARHHQCCAAMNAAKQTLLPLTLVLLFREVGSQG
jgi:hypothetical protein